MNKGILLIALGHPNYLMMAINLAASIKANEPRLLICLVTDKMVPLEYINLFDVVTQPDESVYTNKGKVEYIQSKLFMYDLTPFRETIFLDVDQIVLQGRKLSTLFEELKDVPLTFSNTGLADVSVWVDLKEVKELYGDKPFWNYHSEFVYFKKTKEVKAYFQEAKKIYHSNKLKTAFKFAGGTMADELAFQLAAIKTGMYPHKENYLPNFWYKRHGSDSYKYPYQLKDKYYTYSIGGSTLPVHIANNYNNLAASYLQKLGLQNAYKATNKRSFLPERIKL